ncbi:hypothetical protein GQ43DRAFT_445232 [Delitschia confertaspora ATCC 74209]|uniref:Uncharacterized protein n=1 Tax=Delitschia confertaspora ATCC 74209 TaxID=1513339 RepID=A0A9P4MQT6_9PLEO|nr:hypothetical protein GQ43DRAFT_445232 [Delitschia confertaspora ATCC 74209]
MKLYEELQEVCALDDWEACSALFQDRHGSLPPGFRRDSQDQQPEFKEDPHGRKNYHEQRK